MSKIRQVSTYVLIILNILIVLIPLFIALNWGIVGVNQVSVSNGSFQIASQWQQMVLTPQGYINLNQVHWTIGTKSIGISADILGTLPLFCSFFLLKKIFTNYRQGKIFNINNAKYYRYLGGLLFIDALLAKPLSGMLQTLAIGLTNPPGHRYLSLSFGTPNLTAIFCGILIITISWVMVEASKLHDEQQFTV